ncbi:LBD25 [Arabidopsis thaliana]|uniref:LBD25 n=1 Tax=Arabidopsis thaliana TaxID=3702 RepID=A0A178VJA4_ARATH|nr:LBD25 [Arabidopsis thaliana]
MPKRETKKIKPSQEVIKEGPFLVAIHLKVIKLGHKFKIQTNM